jgi:cyclic pyranopterin phosphate synthase
MRGPAGSPRASKGGVMDQGNSEQVPADFSHIDPSSGGAQMVDVGEKDSTARSAVAAARVRMSPGVLRRVLAEGGPKGPILEVARVAGIQASKRTQELIPMCHSLALDCVKVDFEADLAEDSLLIRCEASCHGATGVEMEALTGASVAALTIYDMVKAVDRGMRIEDLRLLEKKGGRSGLWRSEI